MSRTNLYADYKLPTLCLCLSLGIYYCIQAFIPDRIKTRTRSIIRSLALWTPEEERKEQEKTRGDGLVNIFTKFIDLPRNKECNAKLKRAESFLLRDDELESDLNEIQQTAFDILLKSGIVDSSISLGVLKAMLRNASSVQKTRGDFIFQHTDEKKLDLLILKSGTCEVLFFDERCEDNIIVSTISDQRLLASVIDIVSWLIGDSRCKCLISVRCTEDCEVVSVPSPMCDATSALSPMYVCTYANLVRSLLIRFSRTTITTSLFYLGLAEHMLPKVSPLRLPPDLQIFCQDCEETSMNTSKLTQAIKEVIGELLGTETGKILLPLADADLHKKSPSVGIGLHPIDPKHFKNGTIGSSLSELNLAPLIPPVKRAQSLGVHQVYDDSASNCQDTISCGNSQLLTSDKMLLLCPNEASLAVKTGLVVMNIGQSILDVDPVPGCYIIVSGCVTVRFQGLHGNNSSANKLDVKFPFLGSKISGEETLYKAGAVLGQISLLLGNSSEWYGRCDNNLASPAVMTMMAIEKTCLIKVPMISYEAVIAESPEIIFKLARIFIADIPPIIRMFDFCTKWIRFSSGEEIVKGGSNTQGKLHIVLFGRVRMIVEANGNNKHCHVNVGGDERHHIVMGRGALIGDSQLLTGGSYQHTVIAIRQTMISELSGNLLSFLADKYPSILTHLARNITSKHELSHIGSPPSKSFLIVPISSSAPVNYFTSVMKKCLAHCANKVNLVTSNDVRIVFDNILDGLSDHEYILTVGNWLHQIEMDSDIVIYQADSYFTIWNELCVMRTDEVILFANAADFTDGVNMKHAEKTLLVDTEEIPKTIVLAYVNPTPGIKPRGTRDWIEARKGRLDRHVNIRLHMNWNFPFDTKHYSSDCNRLARILTNNAVGLVLGGGGARGISHVGVLQALEESCIPIDVIGGTSIGALIGGCYARENSFISIFPILKSWCQISSSYWFYIMDLTFPYTSYFNGINFTKSIAGIFGQDKIEDFWINYYCMTTDLTSHGERVHMNGTAYRYIRASMSLTNYIPPLCDKHPQTGANHYLVDGGYVNCVPISVMRQVYGAKTIIAVDVSSNWNLTATYDYGNELHGGRVLLSKLNPFAKELSVPSMAEISNQLAFVGAVQQLSKVKELADICISPPVQEYSVLEFSEFDTLKLIGLKTARYEIEKWLRFLDTEVGESTRQDGKYSWVNNAKSKLTFCHQDVGYKCEL